MIITNKEQQQLESGDPKRGRNENQTQRFRGVKNKSSNQFGENYSMN